jgi:cytochrome P450
MPAIVVSEYKHANETLRLTDLRQALYDEGAILMDKVLVNLHGDEHRARRSIEIKVFRRDFFEWYEKQVFPTTLRETLAPYLAAGKTDLVDFGFRVMMNLTADFSGVDRPERSPEETARLLRILRTFGKAGPRSSRPWTSSTTTSSALRWPAGARCWRNSRAARSPRTPCRGMCWSSCCAANPRHPSAMMC